MNTMKAYSSRALNKFGLDALDRRRWARHGSPLYLWEGAAIGSAVEYVARDQGVSMEVFVIEPSAP